MQMQFMFLFSKFIGSACTLSITMSSSSGRKDRKISDEHVDRVIQVRGHIKNLKDFMEAPKVKAEKEMFSMSVQELLAPASERPASLDMRFDLAPLSQTMASTEAIIGSICSDWEEDGHSFFKLVEGWMPAGWMDCVDNILEESHKQVLEHILDKGHNSYERVGRAGLVLNAWRQRFKKINADSSGLKMFSLDFIQRLDFVGTIQRYCDFAYAAQTIIITLPQYNNHNAKKAAAVKFGEELLAKKISPGKGLMSYLEALKAGAALPNLFLPEKKPEAGEALAALPDGEPGAGSKTSGAGGADDEPEAKRQKVPLQDGA
jgi:hypothetical protein